MNYQIIIKNKNESPQSFRARSIAQSNVKQFYKDASCDILDKTDDKIKEFEL